MSVLQSGTDPQTAAVSHDGTTVAPPSAHENARSERAVGNAVDEDRFADVTDEQIENAIVRAVLAGRDAVAELLRDALTRRQRDRAGVVTLPAAKR